MVLATRCSRCGTIFRVVSDQLKLRGGLVRCGVCSQVFDGYAAAIEMEAADLSGLQPEPQPGLPPAPQLDPQPGPQQGPRSAQPDGLPREMADEPAADGVPDVIRRRGELWSTLGTGHDEDDDRDAFAALAAPGPVSPTAPAADHRPFTAAPDATPTPATPWPPLFAGDRRAAAEPSAAQAAAPPADPRQSSLTALRGKKRGRAHRLFWDLAALAALLALAGQATWMFRDDLATYLPSTRPFLEKACAVLGCRVGYLRDPKLLSIESSSLEPRNAPAEQRAGTAAGGVDPAGAPSPDGTPATAPSAEAGQPDPASAGAQAGTPAGVGEGAAQAGDASATQPDAQRSPSPDAANLGAATPAEAGEPDAAGASGVSGPLGGEPRARQLMLDVVLRNRARFAQPWPAIEVSLTDFSRQVVARKVVLPDAYLGPQELSRPLRAGEERTLRIPIDTRDVSATGYRVALFFP